MKICLAEALRLCGVEGLRQTPKRKLRKFAIHKNHLPPNYFSYLSFGCKSQVDISKHYSKDFESLDNKFRDELNTVFTLCKEEVCPVLNSKAQILSIPFDDPASDRFSSNQLDKFREVRDSIFDKLKELKNLFEN